MERKLKDISITLEIMFLMVLVMYSEITENEFLFIVALVYAIFLTVEIIIDIIETCKDKIKRKKDS